MEKEVKFPRVEIKKLIIVVIAVCLMGASNSFLSRTSFGTDPYTFGNLNISKTIGLSLGTWQLILNISLLLVLLIFARDQLGWGTIANMILVGYSYDFCTWIENKLFPSSWVDEAGNFTSLPARIGVMIPALIVFLLAAAVYMTAGLGASPYDAVPFVICDRNKKIPFRPLRIAYDSLFAVIGLIFGGKIGLVTILMCVLLGPIVVWTKKNIIDRIMGNKK